MFVITTRPGETKPSRLEEAIRQHMVIDVPSKAVLDSMNKAFDNANRHHGKEQLFYVGKKGNISIIVEGNEDSVGSADNKQARKDLAEAKGDEPAYDVHTHADSLSAGNGTDFAWPSQGDANNANFRDRLQASVVLAYEPEIYHEAGIPSREGLGLPPSIRNARRITFYYKQIKPIKISYSDFNKAVQKITGTDQATADHPHLPYHTR